MFGSVLLFFSYLSNKLYSESFHEFNGNIDLLENVEEEDKKNKYIEMINKEIGVINDLILQLLDLSRLEANALKT